MAIVVPLRTAQSAAPRPALGDKLQILAQLDPVWLRALEQLVDWKLTLLGSKRAS